MEDERNANPSFEDGRVGVIVKVAGDNLAFSVAWDAFVRLSDACFTTFLVLTYLEVFSRWQVRSMTNTLGAETWKPCQCFQLAEG